MLHVRIFKVKDAAEAAKLAADQFEALIAAKPACLRGLATGSTPMPLYRELNEREKSGRIDFSRVRSANLDEYKGLSGDHDQSYRYFMQKNLFNHINIDKANTNVPNGLAEDVDADRDSVYGGDPGWICGRTEGAYRASRHACAGIIRRRAV